MTTATHPSPQATPQPAADFLPIDAWDHVDLATLPEGRYACEDFLDNDGIAPEPVRIAVKIAIRGGEAVVDFTGTAAQTEGSVNANHAVATAAFLNPSRNCLLRNHSPRSCFLRRLNETAACTRIRFRYTLPSLARARFDFPPLDRSGLWHPLLVVAAAVAALFALTGVWLAWRRLRRGTLLD